MTLPHEKTQHSISAHTVRWSFKSVIHRNEYSQDYIQVTLYQISTTLRPLLICFVLEPFLKALPEQENLWDKITVWTMTQPTLMTYQSHFVHFKLLRLLKPISKRHSWLKMFDILSKLWFVVKSNRLTLLLFLFRWNKPAALIWFWSVGLCFVTTSVI